MFILAIEHVMLYKTLPVVPSYSSVDEAMIDVVSSAGDVSPFKKFTNQPVICLRDQAERKDLEGYGWTFRI